MNELELKESIIRAGTGIDESTRAAIRAELTAELRGERATVVTPSVPPAQRDWRRPAALLAAAACVALVAAGIVAFTGRDDDATTVVSDSEPSVTPTTAGTTTVSPTTSPPAADLLSRLEGRRWIASAADSAPITTPFVPWVEFSDTAESFLTGIDGCNGFGADGELDGDLLSVLQIGSRAMRCGETLPVITPLDGLRLELDPDGTTLHMFDEGGAERLTYAALDSFGAADGESFPALWWWPTGGTIPAIDIRADGTAGVGSCELTWSITGGSVSVTGWPADPSSCRADTMDERTSRLIELLSGGAADVRIAPDGASLYLSDDQLVLRVVRETTDERPSDPSDVDMLAEWPMRPDLAPSIDAVPLLLPTVEVEGATDVVRTEWADGQAGHDEYVQAWVVDPGQVVLVTTRIGQHADPAAAAEPADVAGWDTAFFADSVPGVVILTLDDPSGTVTVWAKGIDSETVESFAGELARRDRAP
ncbi:MAG TPA: hypothetical protein VGK49_12720, partial [Ilumatobacteraceae bacterium]